MKNAASSERPRNISNLICYIVVVIEVEGKVVFFFWTTCQKIPQCFKLVLFDKNHVIYIFMNLFFL